MSIEVTILGSGSARPVAGRCPSSHALEHNGHLYLIDCGEGTQMRLAACTARLSRLRAIFLTHRHADHVLGLFGLLSSLALLGHTRTLHLYGPPEMEEVVSYNLNFFIEHREYEIFYHPHPSKAGEVIYDAAGLTVRTLPLIHRVPAFGFRFDEREEPPNISSRAIQRYALSVQQILALKDGETITTEEGVELAPTDVLYAKREPVSYAYMSDTQYSESARELVHGVDLLYHEATFMESERDLASKTGHSTVSEAARFAMEVEAKHLIIGHFSGRYRNLFPLLKEAQLIFPDTSVAVEGERYRLSSSVNRPA